MESTRIAVFKGREIRKTIYNNEWWFSVIDVIAVLTDSKNSRDYWYKMKIRVKEEDGFELSTVKDASFGRQNAKYRLCQHRKYFQDYSIHSITQS